MNNVISVCWGAFILVWLVAAVFAKRTLYRESRAHRFRYATPVVIGGWLLFRADRVPPPFNIRIVPHHHSLLMASSILCICGLAFCLWARMVLGCNWSGTVTLKESHELIVRGPYRLVRHPIYTGLLAMIIATAIQQGTLGATVGFILISLSFWLKSSYEEEVMCRQFPGHYPAYRKRVRRIIPFIL